MKTTILALAVVFFGVTSIADGAITLLPWTSTETDKFTQHGRVGGDVWVGNTLTLTHIVGENFASSSSDDGQVFVFPNIDSQFVVGIHFEASSSLEFSRALVQFTGRNRDDGTEIASQVISEILITDTGGIAGSWDLSTWIARARGVYFDIPETTVNGVTSVDFFFFPEVFTFPINNIIFFGDGSQPDGTHLAGTTTYANVSWLVSDDPPTGPIEFVPEPSSFLLAAFAVFGFGCRRRR